MTITVNMLSDGDRTFEWDDENRLLAVNVTFTGHRTEFGYDGLGRRAVIREFYKDVDNEWQKSSEKNYLFDGVSIAVERDVTVAANVTEKQFYSQGFVESDGSRLYYTRDHLGSIRELTDANQAVVAKYDYDPYGRMTKVSGDKDSLFGYTGHVWHAASGLNLTLFRAYDPNLGRWISRDPIGVKGGINAYHYINNSPLNYVDPLGLFGDGRRTGNILGPLGHSDFYGGDYFDFTKEDYGDTNPYRSPSNHFKPLWESEKDVDCAIRNDDKDAFERAMHRGQDHFSHYLDGYRWDPRNFGFGHLFSGSGPDENLSAWKAADQWTRGQLQKWDAAHGY